MALDRKKTFAAVVVFMLVFSASAMSLVNLARGNIIPWVWHNSGIVIKADGSVNPSSAPIEIAGDIYRLTGDVFSGIAIRKNGTVLDGNGHRVYGPYYGTGVVFENVNAATVKDLSLNYFQHGIYLENSNGTRLEGNVLRNCGIQVTAGSFGTQIVDNNVTGDIRVDFGRDDVILRNYASSISVSWSTNITIGGNNIADATRSDARLNAGNYSEGIYIDNCNNTVVSGNSVQRKNVGLDIWESTNLTVSGNSLSDNQVGFKLWGSDLEHYRLDIDSTNTVNGKPSHFLVDMTNFEAPIDAGWIAAINCQNLTVQNWNSPSNWDNLLLVNVKNARISNCNLSGGFNGVRFDNVSDITLTRNILGSNGFAGLHFERAVNCIATENRVLNNYWFFDIWHGSKENSFVRNDFIGNQTGAVEKDSNNVWDDGSQGNFWSTFTAVDLNGDGASDSPCLVTATSGQLDNHPLMSTVFSEDVELAAQYQDRSGFQIAMPREYINYTLFWKEGAPWVTVDGTYPMHVSSSQVNEELPMVYPIPPGTVDMHVWLQGLELDWSNYSDVDPTALHNTDIGEWQMIYCPVKPAFKDFLLQIHYEHPVQNLNSTYTFLYDLNIEPYLSPSSFNSVAHFTVKLPPNSSGMDVYMTGTRGSEWTPKNHTSQVSSDGLQVVTFDVVSEFGKPLWGDIAFVLREAVPEFPAWAVLLVFAAVSMSVLVFRVKERVQQNQFGSVYQGKN
jgi:parallel beta-helix repeat protein